MCIAFSYPVFDPLSLSLRALFLFALLRVHSATRCTFLSCLEFVRGLQTCESLREFQRHLKSTRPVEALQYFRVQLCDRLLQLTDKGGQVPRLSGFLRLFIGISRGRKRKAKNSERRRKGRKWEEESESLERGRKRAEEEEVSLLYSHFAPSLPSYACS